MSKGIIESLKKLKTLSLTVAGWAFLLCLWYRMMFSHNSFHHSLIAFKNISIFAVILLALYFLWSSFNIEKYIVQSAFNHHFIRYNTKAFPWAEITYNQNNNIVAIRKRYEIICQKKGQNLPTSRRLSYSAILIRDGHIKEAIGYLRQLQYDPYAGQLARKIADSELNLLFSDLSMIRSLKEYHDDI